MNSIYGKKIGMTRIFTPTGDSVGVTAIEVEPMTVMRVKTEKTDGYNSAVVAFGGDQAKLVKKPVKGQFEKAGLEAKRHVKELAVADRRQHSEKGAKISVDIFKLGELVHVSGISRGLGFQGGVRRHHFKGGPKTHGQSDRMRAPGSVGASSYPSRTFKGQRMAGHMGNTGVTVKNVKVVGVEARAESASGRWPRSRAEKLHCLCQKGEVGKCLRSNTCPKTGTEAKTVALTGPLFETEPKENILQEYVRGYLKNQRQGNQSTLNRARMKGGGKKPFRQKGTGRARAGSNTSPVWTGGAVVFGPTPKDHYVKPAERTQEKRHYFGLFTASQGRQSAGGRASGNLRSQDETGSSLSSRPLGSTTRRRSSCTTAIIRIF